VARENWGKKENERMGYWGHTATLFSTHLVPLKKSR